MITTAGKTYIKRYLAQYTSSIARSVAFGIGSAAEALGDVSLQLQTTQSPINLVSYDFANNQVVFKASVPDNYVGSIYEVGVYSLLSDPNVSGYGSRLITTFDSNTEGWYDTGSGAAAAFDTTVMRVGSDGLSHTPALSATTTSRLGSLTLDLSGHSSSDSFTFALNVANTNTSSVTVRFLTDASNYYLYNLGTSVQSAGYKMIKLTKGSATVTGSPNWNNITEIQVATTSSSAGASSVVLDAIRVEDIDSINLDYILVARKVLASPVVKLAGQAQDIEFALDVTV